MPTPTGYFTVPNVSTPFFLYDPMAGGMFFFESKEAMEAAAKEILPDYFGGDDGWEADVSLLCAGRVTHMAVNVGDAAQEHYELREVVNDIA